MAKLKIDDKTVRNLAAPAKGNRIDYDVPKGERDRDFVRGFAVRTTAAGTRTFLLVYVTADGRERRDRRVPPVSQGAGDELTLELEADDEEEHRQQPVRRPRRHRQVEAPRRRTDDRPGDRPVGRPPRRVRPHEPGRGGREQQHTAGQVA